MTAQHVSTAVLGDLLSHALEQVVTGGLSQTIFAELTDLPRRYLLRQTRPASSKVPYVMLWLESAYDGSKEGIIGLAWIEAGIKKYPSWRVEFRFNAEFEDHELCGPLRTGSELTNSEIDQMVDKGNPVYIFNQLKHLCLPDQTPLVAKMQFHALPDLLQQCMGTLDGVGLGYCFSDVEGALRRSGVTDGAIIRFVCDELRSVLVKNAAEQSALGDAARILIEYTVGMKAVYNPFIMCVAPRLPAQPGREPLYYSLNYTLPFNYSLVSGKVSNEPPLPPAQFEGQQIELPRVAEYGLHGFEFLILPSILETNVRDMRLSVPSWMAGLIREAATMALKRQVSLWTLYHARCKQICSDEVYSKLADPLFHSVIKLHENSAAVDTRFFSSYVAAYGCLAQWEYEKQSCPHELMAPDAVESRLVQTKMTLQVAAADAVASHSQGMFEYEKLAPDNIFEFALRYRARLNEGIQRLSAAMEHTN